MNSSLLLGEMPTRPEQRGTRRNSEQQDLEDKVQRIVSSGLSAAFCPIDPPLDTSFEVWRAKVDLHLETLGQSNAPRGACRDIHRAASDRRAENSYSRTQFTYAQETVLIYPQLLSRQHNGGRARFLND
jgi:hypothetical protein